MMRLFGGLPCRTFDAYEESFALLAGHADRVALYPLYFLLVHVAIFGLGASRRPSAACARSSSAHRYCANTIG